MRLPFNKFARRSQAGFTMVEIALCLAIVGFALVAIIGVLPAGLNVQKENREDTILNQDASAWLDAIRAGGYSPNAPGNYDDLTNYVDRVVVTSQNYDTATNPMGSPITLVGQWSGPIYLTNGASIVGMLSTPRIGVPLVSGAIFSSNYVYAYVRAMSGAAADKAPQNNPDVRDLAFGYRMVVEITPSGGIDPAGIKTNQVDRIIRNNLSDVRLLFRWPLQRPFNPGAVASPGVVDPPVGAGRMTFRTQLSGLMGAARDANGIPFYYLQPREYR
jgi:type II secretory pathway pseudopilin PulG